MNQSTKISLIVGGVLIVLAGVIGITFAYFSTGGVQDTANTFNSGCLNISLTNESTSINLTDAYPITDVEGLETTSYDFTVKNNCNSATNYQINLESLQINLESLNEQVNSLNADYIKVSLSSDTVDNVISILSSNTSVTPTIDNAYESYNLYTDSLDANGEKTYHLKIWVDYEATAEQAANKVYSSKINVIANPETTIVDTLEAKFNIEGTTATATLTENVTSASYCTTTGNICTPNTSATISNNTYEVELEGNENKQMVCTKLNGTSKLICSNGVEVKPLCPEGAEACNTILAGKNIDDSRNGAITGTLTTNTTGTVYSVADDWGTSYVYAGAPADNWVQFAGYYWRIIRINGDGSIRLIYNGTSTATTGTSTQIQTSAYNSTYNDNAYVGYMYGSTGASSYSATHANTNNSTIKGILDSWYKTNIVDKGHSDKVSTEAGFCNDRKTQSGVISGYGTTGYGTNATTYAPLGRLMSNGSWKSSQTPSLKCSQIGNDMFTVSGSSKGNHKLTYPIGLITSDEVVLAGGFAGSSNNSYYLYTGEYYWTMSPYYFFSTGSAHVFRVYSDGNLNSNFVNGTRGVRPVINLKADITITGEGTSSNPYKVS